MYWLVLMMYQLYDRFPETRTITYRTMIHVERPQEMFRGRQKMFGDLSVENLR